MSETADTCFRCGGKGVIESAPMSCGVRCWDECPVCGDKAEITRLQSRIEELERALRPFVDLADEASSCHPSFDCNSDECVLEVFYGDDPSAFADIKFGDLRQARSTLEASNKGGPGGKA